MVPGDPSPPRSAASQDGRAVDRWSTTMSECFLLRVDPALGSRQLDGHVRQGHSHRRAIRRTAMVRRKKEWASVFVAFPGRADELRLGRSATMVDEILDPVVAADVQIPGISGRVASLRGI